MALSPLTLNVPTVLLPGAATPSTVQVTAVLVVPDTEAVKFCVAEGASVAEVGLMLTATVDVALTVMFSACLTQAPL